jgi:hypothetical protein
MHIIYFLLAKHNIKSILIKKKKKTLITIMMFFLWFGKINILLAREGGVI